MSEASAVERSERPVTKERLVEDFRALGVEAGDTLLVHSSLRALGWVPGGAQTVVDALQEAVTAAGTIVMPTHTSHLCSPEAWSNPPIPEAWLDEVRASMPAFDPVKTPTRGMGAVVECFRRYPDVVRSDHPQYSFAAWGADRDAIVEGHALDGGLGEASPLARVYDRDGRVLMLGTDYQTCTSLHLAEDRADYAKAETTEEGPVRADGERAWVEWIDIERSTDDFPVVGGAFEAARPDAVTEGEVGAGAGKLVSQRALVEYAAAWFGEER
ncbi:aminoglycoside N(3)-acetyltransferase [Halocalculus aciditolerans]|uniref:AAC(3) family N-acetyltransferase n=1 Tax=Halocalculus aciditolerans TaxID=1383812 RepID=A0A830FMR9_9EURY|nr:AAC(3) family N-acetyltransferase [Halocalculus aciditolerans]GGL61893.1 AAC(3) family N-acetyltransferase [Halocalculus aciditolerans]